MNKTQIIKEYCRSLKLRNIADNIDDIVLGAENQCPSYIDYTATLLHKEVLYRQGKDAEKRRKAAHVPLIYDLDNYVHINRNAANYFGKIIGSFYTNQEHLKRFTQEQKDKNENNNYYFRICEYLHNYKLLAMWNWRSFILH